MKKYENRQIVIKNFKNVLLKYVSDLKINEYYLEKAFDYLIAQIANENLNCVIGLSQTGTKMLREKFGFNQENTAYTYDEISKKYNIKNIQVLSRIVFHNLYIVSI